MEASPIDGSMSHIFQPHSKRFRLLDNTPPAAYQSLSLLDQVDLSDEVCGLINDLPSGCLPEDILMKLLVKERKNHFDLFYVWSWRDSLVKVKISGGLQERKQEFSKNLAEI